ncbi:MAG: hypothetical protein F6K22_10175 [Okeania sp. SIO2F4]|uniref:hypothetical protein n=1 Tax=Okeania sp. SIO2F4 TaxID=2607790 RepID=UPI00142946E6|nr:hypothetical protein [Okeania sp. SIO2F4]NES03185.1 hypothetical protein [Okeania sp. SIO2F4]
MYSVNKFNIVKISVLVGVILSSSSCESIGNMQSEKKEQELLKKVELASAVYYCEYEKPYPNNENDEEYQRRQNKIEAERQNLELTEIRAKQGGLTEEKIQEARDAGEAKGRRKVAENIASRSRFYLSCDYFGKD